MRLDYLLLFKWYLTVYQTIKRNRCAPALRLTELDAVIPSERQHNVQCSSAQLQLRAANPYQLLHLDAASYLA